MGVLRGWTSGKIKTLIISNTLLDGWHCTLCLRFAMSKATFVFWSELICRSRGCLGKIGLNGDKIGQLLLGLSFKILLM